MASNIKTKKKFQQNGVFHIKLGNNVEKINLKDPGFLKILEKQYAIKYLQNLGVETTTKNINRILKQNPIDECQIIQSRLNGGLHTDTITIIRKKQDNNQEDAGSSGQVISNEMLRILDLKKMGTKTIEKQYKTQQSRQNTVQNVNCKDETFQGLQFLSFNIKDIKQRYIFPFNYNYRRSNNFKLKDVANLLDDQQVDNQTLFQAKIFKFPFTQVKLNLKTLKELQNPITTKLHQIEVFLFQFQQQFPYNMFPMHQHNKLQTDQNLPPKTNIAKDSHIYFHKKQIDKMFQMIKSQQNAKLIGVLLHLSYWCIFGGVNPIQVDLGMKKKMYIMIFQTLEYFQLKAQHKRTWQLLIRPMLLLTLKMACHYYYTKLYPKLFINYQSQKTGVNQIAFDKILFFIEKLLDQGNLNGRFIFLQSDIDGPKGNFTKDKKFIRKRIFGTSPGLQLILPKPKDGKTRSIMAKNNQIDIDNGTRQIGSFSHKKHNEDIQCRQKLLHLALLKINNRVQQKNGSDANPIIRLKLQ